MPTAYIICDNDSALHVVMGNDKDKAADDHYAEQVKKKIADHEREQCKKHYGNSGWEEVFKRHFFHINRVTAEEAPNEQDSHHQHKHENTIG